MVSAAALLWALNGTVSKVILASGVSSLRLAEVRSTGAVVLALSGLSLVVDLWHGVSLDSLGVAAAIGAAFAYALYVLLAERAVGSRDPASLLAWGFLFAAVFWAVVQPWWSFPAHLVDNDV